MLKVSLPSLSGNWTAAILGLLCQASLCSSLRLPVSASQMINPASLDNHAHRNLSFPITYTTLEEVFKNSTVAAPKGLRCFTQEDPHVNPTSPQACKWTQDSILRRDFPTMPFDVQHFAHKPVPDGWHGVPDEWVVQWRETERTYPCRIIVSSARKTDEDDFSLFDIAAAAQILINTCLAPDEKSKRGGLIPVGPSSAFFVALDGFGPVASDLDSNEVSRM